MRLRRPAFAAAAALPRTLSPVLLRPRREFSTGVRATLLARGAAAALPERSFMLNAPASAYVHLPFCVQKCGYCDFAVTVSTNRDSHSAYVSTLIREIESNFALRRCRNSQSLRTVYLGGGTPSLLAPSELIRVLKSLDDTFGIAEGAEVTAEMDPATFDLEKAAAFRAAGVTRVSVGVQSTDDALLAACGRVHRARDVNAAFAALHRAGFRNISADVMAGLPGQSLKTYEKTLREVLQFDVAHVSAYDLTIEQGTRFGRMYTPGVSPLPEEKESVRMLEMGERILEAEGFERYEISNYARGSQFRSRHNMAYWEGMAFMAFGLGATSLADGFRFSRPRVMAQYRTYVSGLRDAVDGGADGVSVLYPGMTMCSSREMLEDFLINRFRLLVDGVQLGDMRNRFSDIHVHRLLKAVRCSGFLEQGLVEVLGEEAEVPHCVRLTRRGAMIENSVLATLLQEAVWNFAAVEDKD